MSVAVAEFKSYECNSDLNSDNIKLVQSWYPIIRACEIVKDKPISVEVLGHSIIVFRNRKNQICALKRHCCHMGGDLSRGKITEHGIQCPIHNWEFDGQGKRLVVGGKDQTCINARQPYLQCTEKFGIVFVFFGPKPLFEPPSVTEPVFYSSVIVREFDAHYDVPTIFGFDSEHFSTVHNRGLESMELYSNSIHHLGTKLKSAVVGNNFSDRIMRVVGLSMVDVEIDYWGANIMLGHHKRSGTFVLLTSLPTAKNRMRMFITLMQKKPSNGIFVKFFSRLRFVATQPIIRAFISQDERALEGVRFDSEKSLLSNNDGVLHWLEHYQTLPKISASQIFHAN